LQFLQFIERVEVAETATRLAFVEKGQRFSLAAKLL
jgi:hypothetical protein